MKSEKYKNGQVISDLENNVLTYFFKSGVIKASGLYINQVMEGEWRFYRENGQLWQIGHFSAGNKNGTWIRYNKDGEVEYEKEFVDNKVRK
jgi:antitoxin component YwqK of YwqJK toxin-antitoxin module